jgi:hypothetical protein
MDEGDCMDEDEPTVENLTPERHHWWPECVSRHWEDDKGCTHRLEPSGKILRAPAKNFGVLKGGHDIKPDKMGRPSVWDHRFESEFQRADNNFPRVIDWLESLDRQSIPLNGAPRERFLAHNADDESIRDLVEGMISLVVRSPKFRSSAVSLAEYYRGELPARERNALIGMNIMRCQRRIADSFGANGKFAILYAVEREFIFGDGFYHNLSSNTQNAMGVKMVIPITPNITAICASPIKYISDPKLVTITLNDSEVSFFNETVKVYSKEFIFYKSQAPKLIDDFRRKKHLVYASPDPMAQWLQDLSGLPSYPNPLHFGP